MTAPKTLSVLGTEYTIERKKYKDDPEFADRSVDGYCDPLLHKIVLCEISTFPGWEKEPPEKIHMAEQATLRHEIVHAFLDEAGLMESSLNPQCGWAVNEEMVDWIALVGPRIFKAWYEAGALTSFD